MLLENLMIVTQVELVKMNQDNQNLNINLNDAEDATCEECGCLFFKQVYAIKKLSALISPTGQEMMVPVQLFHCSSCGHMNESFYNL